MSKFCGKCGAKMNDQESFCSICGEEVPKSGTNVMVSNPETIQNISTEAGAEIGSVQSIPTKKSVQKNKMIIIIAGIAVVGIIALILFCVNASKYTTIDMQDYLTVKYEGINGYGTASYSFNNDDSFLIKIADAIGIDVPVNESNLEDILSYSSISLIEDIYDSIDISLDNKKNLSNGDTVKLTVMYNESMLKSNGIKLKNTDITFKVNGLKEGTEYDVFEGLKIVYSGVSPYLNAEVNTSECTDFAKEYVTFQIQQDLYFKNGDSVNVTATCNKQAADENGYLINTTEKSYKVENQPTYLTAPAGFDLSSMEKEISDSLAANTIIDSWGDFAGLYMDAIKVTSSSVKAKIILNKKDVEDYGDINRIIYFYEYNLSTENGSQKAYVAITVKDVYANAKNVVVGFDGDLDFYSNESYTELYDNLVTMVKEDYNVQDFTK